MPELHPTLEELSAGLSLTARARHRIVLPPPVVRVRMTGMLFDTDKAFLLPSAMPGIRRLKEVYDQYPGYTVLVSGHADRAGTEAHNLPLSVERADAIAAFVQDVVDDWLPWYGADKPAGKRWGAREDQQMLTAIPDAAGTPYFAGPALGKPSAAAKAALERFQQDQGLPTGPADEATRRKLIQAYMSLDGTTLPSGTTIETHGCGESHPSQATKDSVALAENRRVEVFFFRDAPAPPPVDPCPAGGCAGYPAWVKGASLTIDVNAQPEGAVLVVDEIGLPLVNAPVRLLLPGGRVEEVTTDAEGILRPRVPPGSAFEIEIGDAHEGGGDDSLVTPSGHHFGAGAPGPQPPP